MAVVTLADLKQRFADALVAHETDLATLAFLATEILAVCSDPNTVQAAHDASVLGRERLDSLIAQARVIGAGDSVAALVNHLGSDLGFAGNARDYYSVNNSDLGWVLAQRRGIPITLAIVYIEVGRELGFELRGVGFPGHFLVGTNPQQHSSDCELIDPFAGKFVTRVECMQILSRMQSPTGETSQVELPVNPELFVPAEPRQIVLRLLENLKQIHLHARATGPVLAALDLQLLVAPESFELRAARESLVRGMFGPQPGQNGPPALH